MVLEVQRTAAHYILLNRTKFREIAYLHPRSGMVLMEEIFKGILGRLQKPQDGL